MQSPVEGMKRRCRGAALHSRRARASKAQQGTGGLDQCSAEAAQSRWCRERTLGEPAPGAAWGLEATLALPLAEAAAPTLLRLGALAPPYSQARCVSSANDS